MIWTASQLNSTTFSMLARRPQSSLASCGISWISLFDFQCQLWLGANLHTTHILREGIVLHWDAVTKGAVWARISAIFWPDKGKKYVLNLLIFMVWHGWVHSIFKLLHNEIPRLTLQYFLLLQSFARDGHWSGKFLEQHTYVLNGVNWNGYQNQDNRIRIRDVISKIGQISA